MSCNNLQILNYNHNVVEVGPDNKIVITDKVKCNSITIPQPVTNILQINSPGPQGQMPSPIGPDGAVQFKSGSQFGGEQGLRYNYTNDTTIVSGSGGNFILQVHGANAEPWAFGIYNDTYSPTQPGLAGWVDNTGESNIGTEIDKPLQIYTNATYNNPTLTISSSGVTVNNKLTVNNGITGSLFGSSSYALTASYVATYSFIDVQVQPYISSSYVYGPYGYNSILTASYAINGGGTIDTGSLATTGSNTFIGNQTISGSIIAPIDNNLNIETSNSCGAIVFDRTFSSNLLINSQIYFENYSWSVEAWANFQDTGRNVILGSTGQPSLNIYFDSDPMSQRFTVQSEESVYNYWNNFTPSLNTWHHIAVGFDGTNINVWLDGEELLYGQQTSTAATYGHKELNIGQNTIAVGGSSAMKLTNLRIVVGSTLYDPNSTSITVPTSQLTAVTNTKLLLLAKTSGSAYTDTSGNNSIYDRNTNWTSVTDLSQTNATNTWQFKSDGTLTVPSNVTITGSVGITGSLTLNGITGDLRPYKIFTSLLTRTGNPDYHNISSGALTKGFTYILLNSDSTTYNFTNVGGPAYPDTFSFIATDSISPNNWGGVELQYDNGAPTSTILENNIGSSIWFTSANSNGLYSINSNNKFLEDKTILFSTAYMGINSNISTNVYFNRISNNLIQINIGEGHGYLNKTPLEIRIYP